MQKIILFIYCLAIGCISGQTLTGIIIIPNATTLGAGSNLKLKAIGIYSNNTSQDISGAVIWTSTTTSVATVSNANGKNGFVTALSIGNAQISATLGMITNNTMITVVSDEDHDGLADVSDNCQFIYNPSQIDTDSDGIGDDCDCNDNVPHPGEFFATSPDIYLIPSNAQPGMASFFYATVKGGNNPSNPGQFTPNYQWYKNGNPVGANSEIYIDNMLNTGDSVYVKISSGTACAAGNDTSNNIIISSTLSVDNDQLSKETIFPNPVLDKIYFKNIQNIETVHLFDRSGRVIKTAAINQNSIDIAHLPKGIYVLKIVTDQKIIETKIIKN